VRINLSRHKIRMLFEPLERVGKRSACAVLHAVARTNHGADVAPAPAEFCRERGFVEEIHGVLVVTRLGVAFLTPRERNQPILSPLLRI
jgi:hypothetical protein